MQSDETEIVRLIIKTHELNPAIERRTKLRKALGISQPTQWRHEKRLGIKPDCRVGMTDRFNTASYLSQMMGG